MHAPTEQFQTQGAPADGRPPLTIATAVQWRSVLLTLVETSPQPALDLRGTPACDSFGIQLLCSAVKTARARGKTFRVVQPSAAILEACAATGIQLSDIGVEHRPHEPAHPHGR